MALLKHQTELIEETIRTSLKNRFENYNPEPAVMPFHTRLLGKDRLALDDYFARFNQKK